MENQPFQRMHEERYELLRKFVQALSDRDSNTLGEVFDLTPVMISEIYELLPIYLMEGATLSICSRTESATAEEWPLLTTYDCGDGDIAVDCYILEDGMPSEAILHVCFVKGELIYGFINS